MNSFKSRDAKRCYKESFFESMAYGRKEGILKRFNFQTFSGKHISANTLRALKTKKYCSFKFKKVAI